MPVVTRTTDRRQPFTRRITVKNGSQVTTTYSELDAQWDYSSRTGLKRALPKGFKFPTDYSASFRYGNWFAARNAFVHARNTSNNLDRTLQGACFFAGEWSNVSVAALPAAAATDRAILAVRSRIKSQHVNLGVAFLERKQTAGLFRSTVTTLGDAISAAKAHDWRKLKSVLKVNPRLTRREKDAIKRFGRSTKSVEHRKKLASDLWLANAYGLQPMLQDVRGAATALAEHDVATPDRYRLKAVGSASVTDRFTTSTTAETGISSGAPANLTRKHRRVGSARYIIHAYMENPALAQAAALGLTNPASWIWEKTPWSFVADWLLPIGAYLDSMDATLGWKFLAGSVTKRVIEEVRVSAVYPNTSGAGYDQKVCSASGVFGYKNIQRSAITGFPFPSNVLNLIKNPLSTGHALNAFALKGSRYR